MPHTTIATGPGMARTEYELGGGSFGWRATLEPKGELTTDSVNDWILQSTSVGVYSCRKEVYRSGEATRQVCER